MTRLIQAGEGGQDKYTHRVTALSDFVDQSLVINDMYFSGYEHYESIPLSNRNEIILRFRRIYD
jgi:hypothetical protein